MTFTLRGAWIALIGLLAAGPAWGFSVTLNPGSFQSEILVIAGGTLVQQFPVGLPETDIALATQATPGDPDFAAATLSYGLSNGAFDFVLDGLFLGPGALPQPHSAVARAILFFSVDSPVEYEISGSMTAENPAGLRVQQTLILALGVFASGNVDASTVDSMFDVGIPSGDLVANVTGSQTGTLMPGTEYELTVFWRLQDVDGTVDQPASATGSARVIFTPEPTTASLLALGFTALAVGQRRKMR